MSAPQSSTGSSGSPSGSPGGDSVTSPLRARFSQSFRWTLVLSALVLLGISASVAYRRPLAPLPHQPPRIGSLAWWDTPLEINSAARTPVLDGAITHLTRSHDGRYVFLVGQPNLLLRYDRHTGEWRELPRLNFPLAGPVEVPAPQAPPLNPVDPRQYPTTPDGKSGPANPPLESPGKGAKTSALPRRNGLPLFPAMLGSLPSAFLAQVAAPTVALDEKAALLALNHAFAQLENFGFADADHGFLQFEDRVLLTRDGGQTWQTHTDVAFRAISELDIETDGALLAIAHDAATVFVRGRPTPTGIQEQQLKLPDSGSSLTWTLRHGWLWQGTADDTLRLHRVTREGQVQLAAELPRLGNFLAGDIGPDSVGYFVIIPDEQRVSSTLELRIVRRDGTTTLPFPLDVYEGLVPLTLLAPAANDLWVLHKDGRLARSSDGGLTWSTDFVRQRAGASTGPHVRLPPPWFFLTLLPIGGLLFLAWRLPSPAQQPGIADRLASDKPIEPGEPDYLGFERVALGLSAYLRNRATTPPLTIAITGPWGGGKSSLMNLLKADLEKWGHKPVWFNAWHHETEEHLLAALLEAVRGQAIPGWLQRGGIGYRTRLLWRRGRRRVVGLSILAIVLAGSLGYLVARPEQIAAVQTTFGERLAQFETLRRLFALPDPKSGASDGEAPSDAAGKPAGETTSESTPSSAQKSVSPATEVTATARPAALALLASLAGLLASLWKGLRAFGVEPARLLSSKSQRASHADLQAQTSFRHQFQQQFRDVTAALRPQTMILFIDDLDRCQPEHAYKVLESVNFLMTSGSCYIVLGLERARIERGIGVLFKELAAEEPAHPNDPKHETAPQRFARRYLEKLINLEVSVPTATPEQLADLLRDRVKRPDGEDAPAAPSKPARRRWPAVDVTTIWMLLVPGLAVLAFMISSSVFVAPPADIRQRVEQTAKTVKDAKKVRDAADTGRSGSRSVKSDTSESDELTPASFQPGELGPQHFWIVLLLGLGVGALGVWRLSIPPGAETIDSKETGDTMDQVCPLLIDVPGITPRRIKQFINRVRYLSMMRGSYTAAPSWWATQLGHVLEWMRSWRKRSAPAASAGSTPGSNRSDTLNDTKLVVLGALFEVSPSAFAGASPRENVNQAVLQELLNRINGRRPAYSTDLCKLVASLTDEDLRHFNHLRQGVRLSDENVNVTLSASFSVGPESAPGSTETKSAAEAPPSGA